MIAMHCIDADAIFNYIMFAARPTVGAHQSVRSTTHCCWTSLGSSWWPTTKRDPNRVQRLGLLAD